MDTIGERIRNIREEKGITKRGMAIQLKIPQRNYGLLEKDDRRLNAVHIVKIAEILNITIASLFKDIAVTTEDIDMNNLDEINNKMRIITIKCLKTHIEHLKEEVGFLKMLIKNM